MATKASTIDYLVEQGSPAGFLSAKKMFGEYGLYWDGRLVALVCDDQLFVKPTTAGRSHLGDVVEVPPYPSAKPSFLVAADRWEDGEWLAQLLKLTASELPEPSRSKRRTRPKPEVGRS